MYMAECSHLLNVFYAIIFPCLSVFYSVLFNVVYSTYLFWLFSRYFLASFYTKYDTAHFVINTASLLSVLIPKLPQLHGVRILGINKY